MVVREDGTKWACQSCLKGHRVSGCNHTDRELVQVPKKGRPVTQCHHCRQERKKRSAHVSCDCGDTGKHHHPREKCVHLREAEERAKAGHHDEPPVEKDPAHLVAIAEEQGCCCHHGGKCSCSILKRETDDPAARHGPAVKPRLEKTSSEGAITHFMNGHHKPVHRKNHAAHEHGMPYRLPVPRSSSDHGSQNTVHRSAESLPLDNMSREAASWLPLTGAPFNAERRMSKSVQTSPKLNPSQPYLGGLLNINTTPTDFVPLTPMRTNESIHSAASSTIEFPPFDQMSGVSEDSLDSLDPWMDMSSLDTTTIKANQTSTQNWLSCSPDAVYGSQPDLTTPPSGTQSESDEIASIEDIYGIAMPHMPEDTSGLDFDISNPNSPQGNRHSLPPGFFGNADFTHGHMSNEWQTAVANSAAAHQGKTQPSASPSSMEGTWQARDTNAMAASPTSFSNPSFGSRPQSRSVGPSSAPTNDALRELFPDIDIDNVPSMSPSRPQHASRKTFSGMTSSMPTSAPIPFEQPPHRGSPDGGLNSQPWSAGPYSSSYDSYISPVNYESDPGYPSRLYTPDWTP